MRPSLILLLAACSQEPLSKPLPGPVGPGDVDSGDAGDGGAVDGGAGDGGSGDGGAGDGGSGDGGAGDGGSGDGGSDTPLEGFVGSPCDSDADCDYDGGVCLEEGDGFSGGMCTAECDLYCPDADDFPVTFCVTDSELPAPAAALGDGACLSRCDLGIYPEGAGCRDGYGCVVASRANEEDTQTYVCMPGAESDLSECHLELLERGVSFEPTVVSNDHPADHPELTCTVDEPVYVHSPIGGVQLRYYDGSETERVLAACEMAHALADTVDAVEPDGVVGLYHIGTYNCRTISGSSSLSRHAYADAIDIYGFEFDDGSFWSVIDDWEDDTTSGFDTEAGAWLYETSYGWHEDRIWNMILTPNYNSAHDNHFHIDLTPGADYYEMTGEYFYGPAPYDD